jgi:hypothetical protein
VTRWRLVFAALCVFCIGAVAQQNAPVATLPTHQHPVEDTPMIDGKAHPEQIPDQTAYRLWLLAVSRSATPTEDEKYSQAVQLKMANLSDRDAQTALPVLASFHERYMKLIHDFNSQAEAAEARGQVIDPTPLLRDRDVLVQSTHDTLKSVLTPDGWNKMDGHIQRQKHGMKIPAAEGLK